MLAGRGAVELWSGHLDEAARVLESGVAAAAAPGGEHERADCLGQLALVEALRGRLRRAAKLAAQATAACHGRAQPAGRPRQAPADPAALVALAWVHLERNELREARSRLKQADAALGASPDKLIGAVACLVAACGGAGRGARRRWPRRSWPGHGRGGRSRPGSSSRLSLAESRACAAAGDIRAALAAAERAGRDASLEAAVTLAHAWAAAGDGDERTARARARAGGRQRGARPGAPAGVAG